MTHAAAQVFRRACIAALVVAAAVSPTGCSDTNAPPPSPSPVPAPSPSPAPAPAVAAPIAFEPQELNLGEVDAATTMEVQLELRNLGTAPLELERVVSDCTCAKPEWPREPIAPGESATIVVTIETGAAAGVEWSKRITALVPGMPPVDARIRATVRRPSGVTPASSSDDD